jgi:YVTN family beta-propeller protein
MTIPDLEVAHGVGFSPDGKTAYFTVESDSTVKSVDTKTGKVTASVKLTGHPNNMSVSKNGKYVFAGIHVAPGAVDVIDTATMKIVKTLPVKGAVHNTFVTPDGKFMVAASVFGSIFEVFDAETLTPAWELKMSSGVRPIAFEKAADGSTARMFVQLSEVHGFAIVDFKTHKEVSRTMLPDQPRTGKAGAGAPAHGIGVSPDNKTLVVNSSLADGVYLYSLPDVKYLGFVATGKVPDWVTFTPDSKIAYIANSGSNYVSAVDLVNRKAIATIPVAEAPKRNGTVMVP